MGKFHVGHRRPNMERAVRLGSGVKVLGEGRHAATKRSLVPRAGWPDHRLPVRPRHGRPIVRCVPVADRLELKIGAKVIFLKNRKPDWINGDLGTVVGLEGDHIRVRKETTDNVLLVSRETWQKFKYVYD